MSVLRAERISKSFRTQRSEWHRVLSWFMPGRKLRDEKQILQDINFEVKAGEAVGIVGQNGAGKSTLLKILAGTMEPTNGKVHVEGRVAALLELGMGFNPDMTGRANALNTAGLMGFSRAQAESALPGIEEFAEIGEYFNQPIRIYSSGMQVRLAFAVATAFRPEILIVDEALSVGDVYFQHKSFDRIRQFRAAGTTLLLVSHDRSAVVSLCDRAILIDKGRVRMDGHPESVLDLYNAVIAEKEGHTIRQVVGDDGRARTVSGTGEAVIRNVVLLDVSGMGTDIIKVGSRTTLQIDVEIVESVPSLVVGYMIKDRLGQPVFGTNTYHLGAALQAVEAGEKLSFRFVFDANFGEGGYSLAVALHEGDTHLGRNYFWQDLALTFVVVNADQSRFVGVSWAPPKLELVR
ncbi:MAG: ABC transporter ATP-binding protein [Nitrospira sp.]